MTEPTALLQAVRASTAGLLTGISEQGWSDADLREPSLCAGWTRGHVLSHLARNADGIAGTVSGALRGEIVPRYPDDSRDADIEAGASRPLVEQLADLAASGERLDRLFAAATEVQAWDAPTADDSRVHDWVGRRLNEIEVHRVDLAGDYGPDQWPALLVSERLPFRAGDAGSRSDVALRLVATEGSIVPAFVGREWTSGTGPVTTVSAPDWALLAWLIGRFELPDAPSLQALGL